MSKAKRHKLFLFTVIATASFPAIFAVSAFLSACAKPVPGTFITYPNGGVAASYRDYIIVSNNATKSVQLLDPDGKFVRELLALDKAAADVPWGLAMYDATNVLITIEGTPDRVWISNLDTGIASDFITDTTNLTGTMRGIARLSGGDILISEGNTIERYSSTKARITNGGWPQALQTTGTQLDSALNDNFVHCSTGTLVVRTYNNAAVQTASATSVAPVPALVLTTNPNGCAVDKTSGKVAVAYAGTNDAIRVYSSTALATTYCTYSNTALIANPAGVSFKSNGNVMTVDITNNVLAEIQPVNSTNCILVRSINSGAISTPNQILVVP